MSVKIQAREIIRAAERLNIEIRRGCYTSCAVGILAQAGGVVEVATFSPIHKIAPRIGVNTDALIALEMGFEGYTSNRWLRHGENVSPEKAAKLVKNRYFKVGQRVAELVGLKFEDKG